MEPSDPTPVARTNSVIEPTPVARTNSVMEPATEEAQAPACGPSSADEFQRTPTVVEPTSPVCVVDSTALCAPGPVAEPEPEPLSTATTAEPEPFSTAPTAPTVDEIHATVSRVEDILTREASAL